MNRIIIIGLAAGVIITFLLVTLGGNGWKEEHSAGRPGNGKFKASGMELLAHGLSLLWIGIIGLCLVSLGFRLSVKSRIFLVLVPAGILLMIDLALLLNHLLHEMRQQIRFDPGSGIVTRHGNRGRVSIDLRHADTHIAFYTPPFTHSFTSRNYKLCGARFSKVVISNAKTEIVFSSLLNIDVRRLAGCVSQDRIRNEKKQLNFL